MSEEIIRLQKSGSDVLNTPLLNKGTAFTQEERDAFGLNGLLPPCISTPEAQIRRSYLNFSQKKTPLEKYDSLIGLLSRNELLFFNLLFAMPKKCCRSSIPPQLAMRQCNIAKSTSTSAVFTSPTR